MKNNYEIRGEITVIFLRYKGNVIETLIDTADLEKVKGHSGTWGATWNNKTRSFYVQGSNLINGKLERFYLHYFLLDPFEGLMVDHVCHDGLDNRRQCLRLATKSENGQNRKGLNSNNTSGLRGVMWDKNRKKWRAQIRLGGKAISLGRFNDKCAAAEVVRDAMEKMMPYAQITRQTEGGTMQGEGYQANPHQVR